MNNLFSMTRSLATLWTAAACLVACRSDHRPEWGAHLVDWSAPAGTGATTRGVDEAAVHFGNCGDDFAFVVWTDAASGGFASRWNESERAIDYDGKLTAADGRAVEVHCRTTNCADGRIAIGEQSFDLRGGKRALSSRPWPTLH